LLKGLQESPWWYSGYCAGHWTHTLQVKNPAKAMDFKGDKNPQHIFLSDGK
jgi:hypothetical protein